MRQMHGLVLKWHARASRALNCAVRFASVRGRVSRIISVWTAFRASPIAQPFDSIGAPKGLQESSIINALAKSGTPKHPIEFCKAFWRNGPTNCLLCPATTTFCPRSVRTSKRRRHRRLPLCQSFMRMFVGGRGMLVCLLAMFVGRVGVLLGLFVFAKIMMVGSLMMMMRGSVVMSGGLMMMLACRMLRRLCHGVVPPNRPWKWDAGCSLVFSTLSRRNYDHQLFLRR